MDDSKTFREQLAIQYPTLGRALWEPDPGGLYNAVQVGDVGFIRQGYFYRLFNALPPRDHPSEHPPESDPFPEYLQRLQPRTSDHIRTTRSRDHGDDFRSTSVSREPNIYASGPDDITFSCSGRQGALLYLPFPTERQDTVALGDFGKWIVRNIYDCMRLAEERGLGISRMEDIILVTGRHLAKSWVRAVFSECQGNAQASFEMRTSGDSVVHFEKRNVSGAQLKFGPNGEDPLTEDQCIFVRGYHVVRVLNIWPRLRGLAGPAPDLNEPEPESDTSLQLIGVPSDDDYQDPLHILLEYIAEQAPACDMVLVHDDDLECIEGVIPPSKDLQPDEWMAFFRDNAPTIHQFQCEFLPGNESESEAEVAIATVATLSRNEFEALHEEESISRSVPTSMTTSKGYERLAADLDGHEPEEEGTSAPASTWWSPRLSPRPWAEASKRKRTVPSEQAESYVHTRSRVVDATSSILSAVAAIGHESLFIGVDLSQSVPVPGLEIAAQTLLRIWDAVEMVEMNRLASLRLAERCADILIGVREEIVDAGYTITEELHAPISKLNEAFVEVLFLLTKLGHRPFLKRYLKRDEILSNITSCDAVLNDALGMFWLSIQIRTLKIIQADELRRQSETQDLLDLLSQPPGLPPPPLSFPLPPPADQQIVQKTLRSLTAAQNAQDQLHDSADLRQLMRTALAANDDTAMIEVLQIARSEMPEAIKTMQRALEHVVDGGRIEADESSLTLASPSSPEEHFEGARVQQLSADSGSDSSGDTLDCEFIESGIDALRRLSTGADLELPSWTITQYEVDLEAKIGIGFFSEVYRGNWQQYTVAIKVLAETTPRKIFVHEVEIWKKLCHPNVIELLGASSGTGDPPWFLVNKYYSRGSLVKYLKGLSGAEYARVDTLKIIHEISNGMAYLHKEGVLHGDLKAENVLVDDDTRCVISDFGQSEMKSEVCRISRMPVPHGTLRWQAPELMQGAQALTPEMDVYAFSICCVEILTKGELPWPLMDDNTVRRFVLVDNMRPSLPPSSLSSGPLMNIIRSSWDSLPSNRPPFEQIAREVKKMRAERLNTLPTADSTKPAPLLDQRGALNPYRSHHLPDILPQPLPDGGLHVKPFINNLLYDESEGYSGSTLGLDTGASVLNPPMEKGRVDSSATGPRRFSSLSSDTVTSCASIVDPNLLDSSYLAPLGDMAARYLDERRYRIFLKHHYHTILTLPLWRPSHVELGAVGFLSKPEGRFETLFNAFNPGATSAGGEADELPKLSGYGKVLQGNRRRDKRNVAQRGFDRVQGLFSSGQTVSRTHPFQLRAGHKVAYLYAETTVFRYITNLDVPKKWFQSNIDHIMKIYGKEQRLTREDIFLVIGALDAPDYASFVSHSHPDGQVNFHVLSPARVGRAWGRFTLTPAEQVSSKTEQQDLMVGAVTANNVSLVRGSSEPWDSVLLARLRFKPDLPEPTSL